MVNGACSQAVGTLAKSFGRFAYEPKVLAAFATTVRCYLPLALVGGLRRVAALQDRSTPESSQRIVDQDPQPLTQLGRKTLAPSFVD